MIEYYYRKDSGNLWRKTTQPTEREGMHLQGVYGIVPWGIVTVESYIADHIDAGHCLCVDGKVVMLPESEWPEVTPDGIS